jgi:predicted nucleotidyltransferase
MATTLLPPLPPHVRAALAEAKARLVALYGDRLDRVVLYGSYARGDAREDSDVDLLVVLRGTYEPYAEGKEISAIRLALSLRHGVDVAMQPYSVTEAADPEHPLMHSVADEGVVL